MRTPPAVPTVLAILLAAPAALAQAVVIDDFETGTLHYQTVGGFVAGVVAVPSPSHAIAPLRQGALQTNVVGGLPATADLDAWTAADDALRLTFPPGGGAAYLTYEPASPVDLTAGGQNDRIEVTFSAATSGGSVIVMVFDGSGNHDIHLVPTSGGVHVFPFLNLMDADLTDVALVQVEVNHPDWSSFDLTDIRAMRRSAFRLRFEIPVETVSGPPYPLPFLPYLVIDAEPSDEQRVRLRSAARVESGAESGIALTGTDTGDAGLPGFAGVLRAEWSEAGVPFASTAFDVEVDVAAVSGISPDPMLPALPEIVSTSTGFLLVYEVLFLGPSGEIARTSQREMTFDTLPGQELRLANAQVHETAGAGMRRSGAEAGFRVTFDVLVAGDVDTAVPLFEAAMTGDCQPAGATGVPAPRPAADRQSLSARPTVTRSGTQLRLARAADLAGHVELFDVTGRRLRSLDVPRGAVGCAWDGRDADGRRAASGVYLARFTDGSIAARTRVIVAR
jgi:hypothetical protein